MIGFKKCPGWLKQAYKKSVNFICEECNKPETEEDPLEVHRLIRGKDGGTYRPGNVKIVHKSCHKKYHFKEF